MVSFPVFDYVAYKSNVTDEFPFESLVLHTKLQLFCDHCGCQLWPNFATEVKPISLCKLIFYDYLLYTARITGIKKWSIINFLMLLLLWWIRSKPSSIVSVTTVTDVRSDSNRKITFYPFVSDNSVVHPVDEGNEGRGRGIKVAPELPTLLEVEILSSKSKVSATVDGATVGVCISIIDCRANISEPIRNDCRTNRNFSFINVNTMNIIAFMKTNLILVLSQYVSRISEYVPRYNV